MTRVKYFKKESDLTMAKIKKINNKLGAPSKSDKKNKNPFLRSDGGFSLVEIFPSYENKKKREKKRR